MHEAFDRSVDSISRGFDIVSAITSAFVVGLVVYFAIVDSVTRIVFIILLVLLGTIWFVGKRIGK